MSLRDLRDVSGLTLFDEDLMQVLGLRPTAFYARKKAGLFDRFLVLPQFGRTQYSGRLVQDWRDGRANVTAKAKPITAPDVQLEQSPVVLRLLKNAAGRSR